MTKSNWLAIPAIAIGLMWMSSPLVAQGRGEQTGRAGAESRGGPNPPVHDQRSGESGRERNGSGRVPSGWCIGVGNPHNTVANCGYPTTRSPGGGGPASDRSGSYEEGHARFHRELDARYERLAAERPLDIRYRLELESRKRAEHDEWHRRAGVSH